MSPRIVDKDEKRAVIAMAALSVFNRKGFHGCRMSDIALEAGIGKGTIYEYFPGKDEIILFIFQHMMQEFDSLMEVEFTHPVEGLVSILYSSLENLDHVTPLMPVFFEILGCPDVEAHKKLKGGFEEWIARISERLTAVLKTGQKNGQVNPDIDARAFVRMIFSAVDGIMLHHILFEQDSGFIKKQNRELEKMIKRSLAISSESES